MVGVFAISKNQSVFSNDFKYYLKPTAGVKK